MSQIDVSVVIPTHRRPERLSRLLATLADQEQASFEVVVVDSKEGFGSPEVVTTARQNGLNVRLVWSENVLASKRNEGSKVASGDVLVFLDDDLRVVPGFLHFHQRRHHETRQLVSGSVTFESSAVNRSNYYRYKSARQNVNRGASHEPLTLPPHRFVAMNFSIRREDYVDLGGFDQSFRHYGGEDVEFGLRASREGFTLAYESKAEALHDEDVMSIVDFGDRNFKATLHGTKRVIDLSPNAASVPLYALTELSLPVQSASTKLARNVLHIMSRIGLTKTVGMILRHTDKHRALYFPLIYDAYIALRVVDAVRARDKLSGKSQEFMAPN